MRRRFALLLAMREIVRYNIRIVENIFGGVYESKYEYDD